MKTKRRASDRTNDDDAKPQSAPEPSRPDAARVLAEIQRLRMVWIRAVNEASFARSAYKSAKKHAEECRDEIDQYIFRTEEEGKLPLIRQMESEAANGEPPNPMTSPDRGTKQAAKDRKLHPELNGRDPGT